MKKIIPFTILTLLVSSVLLSGCFDALDSGKAKLVGAEWQRSDKTQKIIFNNDMTGVVMSAEGTDYAFEFTFDPERQNKMIWTTTATGEQKLVDFYFTAGDSILVLKFTGETIPWAYYKLVGD